MLTGVAGKAVEPGVQNQHGILLYRCFSAAPLQTCNRTPYCHAVARTPLTQLYSLTGVAAGDEHWAERASTKIKKFFLDEETGMLPSLLYAQLKPEMSDVGAPTVRPKPTASFQPARGLECSCCCCHVPTLHTHPAQCEL